MCDEEGLARLGIESSSATLLAGFGQATDSLSIASRGERLLEPAGAKRAFETAMEMAGASSEDLSLQEVHDCFSVMGPLSVEMTGLAEPGQGLKYFADGHARRDGRCPINTSGGLIAKGHPISATGVAMVGWIHQQILRQGARRAAGRGRGGRLDAQHRWPHLQHRRHGAEARVIRLGPVTGCDPAPRAASPWAGGTVDGQRMKPAIPALAAP